MCGIAGFIDFNNQSDKETLKACTDLLSHRGPDGSGYTYFSETGFQIGLGHRRLSIIDLSEAGRQPMQYKQWQIIFNGEMYNYAEVKIELEGKGHSFISHSDTEVILHAWEQWGMDMITRFIGMFTFALYDSEKKELICCRDRAGVKPFYYYWNEGLFLFASELKAIHRHPGFKKQINKQALHQFLQYGYIMAPLSIYENTYKLLPGHYGILKTVSRSFELKKYWDVYDAYNKPKLKISEQDAIEQTEGLLISSCRYRMVADVPVGVFLSGGYDSSAVTALLQAHQTEKLKTFTIGFHEEGHNEAIYAKKVADFLGTDHTEHYCTTKEAQDIIPQIPFFCDEPFGDSSIIPTTLVSQMARKNVTVALSADAGDETFAGYNKYPLVFEILSKLNRLPSSLRKPAGKILEKIPSQLLIKLSGSTAAPIKKARFSNLMQRRNISACDILDEMLSQVYTSDQLENLLSEKIIRPQSFYHSESELNNTLDDLDKMLAMDYKTYLVDDILVKVDRATMSTSLEGREPLLDHRIIEFVAQLPSELKMNGKDKKYILKKIVHKYIPPSMMDRPKMGFGVPVFEWLQNDLKFYTQEFMNDKAFEIHGLFKMKEIHYIKKRFFASDRNYYSLFWYILMFQMWYRKWM